MWFLEQGKVRVRGSKKNRVEGMGGSSTGGVCLGVRRGGRCNNLFFARIILFNYYICLYVFNCLSVYLI